ncbi:MAG: hypothetical protein ACPHIW_05795, partial [Ilumatobacteraceae bacterium]
ASFLLTTREPTRLPGEKVITIQPMSVEEGVDLFRTRAMAAGADLYLDPIQRWFGELLYQPDLRPHPRVKFAELSERAGAVGAALLHET